MTRGTGEVIVGLDLLDVVGFVSRKNKKYQALMLQEIEEICSNHDEFLKIRKVILDGQNSYTRSVLRVIFGNDFDI
jgi:hypothetical protein